jgi:hypothetical protein
MNHLSASRYIVLNFNPFPADVAIKRHLSSASKSHFCDLTGKTEVIGLSDLMILAKQTQRAFNVFKNTKLIENRFSRSKVIQNSSD